MLAIIRNVICTAILFSSISLVVIPTAASHPGTGSILKAYGGEPCPDGSEFTCVTLSMPLDHFNSDDERTIPVTPEVMTTKKTISF